MQKMRVRGYVLGVALAAVLFAAEVGVARAQTSGTAAVGPAQAADTALEARLTEIAKAHHGKVALYATQLNTGRSVGIDADAVVQTASVIKLTILFEAMEQVREGKAHWDDKIQLNPGDAVSGSGILLFLDAPQTLTLKDVLTLMIVMSDNTATNLSIDKIGLDAVNARIAWLGLKDTHLYKKIGKPATEPMPEDQAKFGLGKSTAREMAHMMERIGLCQLEQRGELDGPGAAEATSIPEKDKAICGVAMNMLRNQFYRDTIPRYLEKLDATETGSGTASKTGSLNALRADVAIVAGKAGPMVLSIFTYDNADTGWTADNEGEVTIAKLARAIVEAWSPQGIDGKMLTPGLGMRPTGGETVSPNAGPAASK
ncbi:MAG TPA: serine hydrolase [Acidobacteriaceae bacterium]|jgi:beta-lactamase class A|nr:serine hydrolase [Acidobacteriaceae bacterium]